eukprot:Amastigsp_a678881_21.p6 type:complete len:133 gc:universal Amastigsp_a678881_21:1408-1010(-)
MGVCYLGADPVVLRPAVQGPRRRERVLPHVHPAVVPHQGEGPHRGLCARGRMGHPCRLERSRRAHRHPPYVRDHHVPFVRQLDSVVPRPSAAAQPMVLSRPLGVFEPDPVHPLARVPLAGGPHCPRHPRLGG